jgi:hypothetical protein
MFVFLLFERATFIRKQDSASLPYLCSPTSPRFFISDAVSSPGPPISSNSIYRHLRRFCYCHIVRLRAMCVFARWNNFSTSIRAFVLSKRLQLHLPWSISVSVGRQPSIIPVEKKIIGPFWSTFLINFLFLFTVPYTILLQTESLFSLILCSPRSSSPFIPPPQTLLDAQKSCGPHRNSSTHNPDNFPPHFSPAASSPQPQE